MKLTVRPVRIRDQYLYPGDDDDDDDDLDDEAVEALCDLQVATQVNQAKAQAQLMADHIFQSLAVTNPRLTAIVIGLNCEGGCAIKIVAFLRSKQADLFGSSTCVGIQTEEKLVKFHEPCSDVLENAELEDLLKF